MRKASLIKTIATLVVLVLSLNNIVRADASREYQLKAAYILNFARFIYWPVESFKPSDSAFKICVYGENLFEEDINLLSTKRVKDRSIEVSQFLSLDEIDICHILFVSESKKDTIVSELKNIPKNILTVSDIEGFSNKGGMIEFVRINNKIKFEINVSQSTKNGIKYRSQLLEVAEQLR